MHRHGSVSLVQLWVLHLERRVVFYCGRLRANLPRLDDVIALSDYVLSVEMACAAGAQRLTRLHKNVSNVLHRSAL